MMSGSVGDGDGDEDMARNWGRDAEKVDLNADWKLRI